MIQPVPSVLVVEDDDMTRAFLAEHLAADGYAPFPAANCRDAAAILDRTSPTLVLSDLNLPDGSGLSLVRRIRQADGVLSRIDPATPVLLLTGRGSEIDRVRGFERGCDDYLVKPFSYRELRLRIEGLLRRTDRRPRAGLVRLGALTVDPSRRLVEVGGTPIRLTQKEYSLLLTLVREPLRVFTKNELLRAVWGYRQASMSRTVDSHACRLRRKLGVHGNAYVVTVWGVGYRLLDAPPEGSHLPGREARPPVARVGRGAVAA